MADPTTVYLINQAAATDTQGVTTDPPTCSAPPSQLPRDLRLRILSLLPANDLTLSGRLAFKDAAQHFSGPRHRTVTLGQPLPSHAVACFGRVSQEGSSPGSAAAGPAAAVPVTGATATVAPANTATAATTTATPATIAASSAIAAAAAAEVKHLSLPRRHSLLSTAAASGCEANLEVAWALLQPTLFHEMLPTGRYQVISHVMLHVLCPGVAAVRSGHAHVLPWLLTHCPGLLDRASIVKAAARHCDLAGLQAVWGLLRGQVEGTELWAWVLDAAAGSATSDAVAKIQWVLQEAAGICAPTESTSEAAAGTGDLARLQWLCEQGCPLGAGGALAAAVREAGMAVVQWLEGEAGCAVPAPGETYWRLALVEAAAASGCVGKLLWARERGLLVGQGSAAVAFTAAARRGHVDALRWLAEAAGPQGLSTPGLLDAAVESGSIPAVSWLLQAGCNASPAVYETAAEHGHLELLTWLVRQRQEQEQGRSPGAQLPWRRGLAGKVIGNWPRGRSAREEEVWGAVQVLEAAGCPLGPEALMAAAQWGSLRLVRHLYVDCGVQLPNSILHDATMGGSEAVVEWVMGLQQQGVELPWDAVCVRSVHWAVACFADRAMLECLLRLGWPPVERHTLRNAVVVGCQVVVLQWLVEHGAAGSRGEVEVALVQAHDKLEEPELTQVVRYLEGLLAEIPPGGGEEAGKGEGAGEEQEEGDTGEDGSDGGV